MARSVARPAASRAKTVTPARPALKPSAKSAAVTQAKKRPARKTAVLVVHGMGEQRPMQTLWGLVKALWVDDPDHCRGDDEVYSKPDRLAGSHELRRITTRESKSMPDRRVDFFELYWAHQMQGNTVAGVFKAVKNLLIRNPDRVPEHLFGVWIVAWLVLVLIVVQSLALSLGLKALLGLFGVEVDDGAVWTLAALLFAGLNWAFGGLLNNWVGPVAGDAARYLSPDPPNIAARQAIRNQAVDLLEALHASKRYDRIVVVGHSLGTVVAYDAIAIAYGRIFHNDLLAAHRRPGAMAALEELESLTRRMRTAEEEKDGPGLARLRLRYRTAQRAYFEILRTATRGDADATPLWLVSDFVSTGSPLSKADVLLSTDRKGFDRRVALRDLITCPPFLEPVVEPTEEEKKALRKKGEKPPKPPPARFSFPEADVRGPHHGAAFAPTVWTNLYFVTEKIVLGDVIAGRCGPLFGGGVLDIRMDRDRKGFRHLDYWDVKRDGGLDQPWIRALRKAVNLRLLDEQSLWGDQAAAPEIDANGV